MDGKSAISSIKKYSTPILSVLRSGMGADASDEFLSWSAKYDSLGRMTEESKFFSDGSTEEIHNYVYDDGGNLISHHLDYISEGIDERFVTVRNPDGNPLRATKFYGEEEGERAEYIYSEKAKPIKILHFDADGEPEKTEELEYDDNSRLIKRTIFSHEDSSTHIFYFSYDENGWLTIQKEKDESEKVISKLQMEYTIDGKEARTKQYNADGKLHADVISEYDEIGRLIRRMSKGFYVRISTFEYDERGNLLEETLSDENGFVITRSRNAYDDENRLVEDTMYETDLTRAGRDTHVANRYEYEF